MDGWKGIKGIEIRVSVAKSFLGIQKWKVICSVPTVMRAKSKARKTKAMFSLSI
jgi:hypothetical protein